MFILFLLLEDNSVFWKNNKHGPKQWGLSSSEDVKNTLWFKFEDNLRGNIAVRFNNYPLRTHTLDDLVTAEIPNLLLRGLGQATVTLHDAMNGKCFWTEQYSFNERWQDPNTFLVGAPRSSAYRII